MAWEPTRWKDGRVGFSQRRCRRRSTWSEDSSPPELCGRLDEARCSSACSWCPAEKLWLPPPPPPFLFVSSPKLCWGDRDPPPSCYLRMSLTNSSVFLLNEVGYYQFSPPFFFSPPPPPPPSLLFWGWSRSNWMRFILAVLLHVSCILSSANKRRRWTQVLVGGRRWCN